MRRWPRGGGTAWALAGEGRERGVGVQKPALPLCRRREVEPSVAAGVYLKKNRASWGEPSDLGPFTGVYTSGGLFRSQAYTSGVRTHFGPSRVRRAFLEFFFFVCPSSASHT